MNARPERRFGLAAREEIAGLSGREVMQANIEGRLPQAPMFEAMGFRLVEVAEGTAVIEGRVGEHLANPSGTVHGGWALAIIDSATACAAYSLLPPDTSSTTIETKGNFSKPIRVDSGLIRCEARAVSSGRRIISCEAHVKDSDGRVLAHGTSTVMVLGPAKQ